MRQRRNSLIACNQLHCAATCAMYRAQGAAHGSLLGEGRVGALGARRHFVVLAEGYVGAAVGAAIGAVARLLSGVIIFHILSSFYFDTAIFDKMKKANHRNRQSKQEITVPAKVESSAIPMAPRYFFILPPPYSAAT